MTPSLASIFEGSFANGFRRLAQWRKAGQLGQARQQSKMRFEPLEQRLLLSADLNPVIDDFLATLDCLVDAMESPNDPRDALLLTLISP